MEGSRRIPALEMRISRCVSRSRMWPEIANIPASEERSQAKLGGRQLRDGFWMGIGGKREITRLLNLLRTFLGCLEKL